MREGPDIVTLEFTELASFDVGSFASINFMTLSRSISGLVPPCTKWWYNTTLPQRTAVEHNFCPLSRTQGKRDFSAKRLQWNPKEELRQVAYNPSLHILRSALFIYNLTLFQKDFWLLIFCISSNDSTFSSSS